MLNKKTWFLKIFKLAFWKQTLHLFFRQWMLNGWWTHTVWVMISLMLLDNRRDIITCCQNYRHWWRTCPGTSTFIDQHNTTQRLMSFYDVNKPVKVDLNGLCVCLLQLISAAPVVYDAQRSRSGSHWRHGVWNSSRTAGYSTSDREKPLQPETKITQWTQRCVLLCVSTALTVLVRAYKHNVSKRLCQIQLRRCVCVAVRSLK